MFLEVAEEEEMREKEREENSCYNPSKALSTEMKTQVRRRATQVEDYHTVAQFDQNF
jgi:hypothetical protein